MASIIEFPDLECLKTVINEKDSAIVTHLNMETTDKYSKSNGYKIFWIMLDKDDPYFEPEDGHGQRIYTILSNKFRDCKSVAIPIYDFTAAIGDNKEKLKTDFIDDWEVSDPFQIYVGNGYVNILTYCQPLSIFHDATPMDEYFGSVIGFILISDGMYKNRSNALDKLISLTMVDD